jgi:hypothetical protein
LARLTEILDTEYHYCSPRFLLLETPIVGFLTISRMALFHVGRSSIQHFNFCVLLSQRGSRDSAVGIATGYGLDDKGVAVRFLAVQDFSPLHVVQTGSGAHPASYPMGTGGYFPRVKRLGREGDNSPYLVLRSRIRESIHPLPHTSSW